MRLCHSQYYYVVSWRTLRVPTPAPLRLRPTMPAEAARRESRVSVSCCAAPHCAVLFFVLLLHAFDGCSYHDVWSADRSVGQPVEVLTLFCRSPRRGQRKTLQPALHCWNTSLMVCSDCSMLSLALSLVSAQQYLISNIFTSPQSPSIHHNAIQCNSIQFSRHPHKAPQHPRVFRQQRCCLVWRRADLADSAKIQFHCANHLGW